MVDCLSHRRPRTSSTGWRTLAPGRASLRPGRRQGEREHTDTREYDNSSSHHASSSSSGEEVSGVNTDIGVEAHRSRLSKAPQLNDPPATRTTPVSSLVRIPYACETATSTTYLNVSIDLQLCRPRGESVFPVPTLGPGSMAPIRDSGNGAPRDHELPIRTAPKGGGTESCRRIVHRKQGAGAFGPRLVSASRELAVRLPAPAVALAYARAALAVDAARSVLRLADGTGRIDAVAVEIATVDLLVTVVVDPVRAQADLRGKRRTAV